MIIVSTFSAIVTHPPLFASTKSICVSTSFTVMGTNQRTMFTIISFLAFLIYEKQKQNKNKKKTNHSQKQLQIQFNLYRIGNFDLLPSIHSFPKYPSWHPLLHPPLTWSHGSLLIQLPLQILLQSIPKFPGEHPLLKIRYNRYLILNKIKTKIKLFLFLFLPVPPLVFSFERCTAYCVIFTLILLFTCSKCHILVLHSFPIYPGLHPLSQYPVCLLHVESFIQ